MCLWSCSFLNLIHVYIVALFCRVISILLISDFWLCHHMFTRIYMFWYDISLCVCETLGKNWGWRKVEVTWTLDFKVVLNWFFPFFSIHQLWSFDTYVLESSLSTSYFTHMCYLASFLHYSLGFFIPLEFTILPHTYFMSFVYSYHYSIICIYI